MKNKQIANESFTFGPMHVSRFGEAVTITNNKGFDNSVFIELAADEYDKNRVEIQKVINEIRELISLCNPLEILKYAYDRFIKSTCGVAAEVNISREDVFIGRELEYIQSVLVSTENKYCSSREDEIDYNDVFNRISSKISKVHSLVQLDLLFATGKELKENKDTDLEIQEFLIESQHSMFVRGDRYTVFEIPHLKSLIEPHNEEFIKLYGISSNQFVIGMEKLQKSLLSCNNMISEMFGGDSGTISKILELYNEFICFEEEEKSKGNKFSSEELLNIFKETTNISFDISEKEDIYDKFNVERVTKFPRELLEDLSYGIDENTYFFNNEYAGYPTIELPVFSKPFIKINDKFYCFDYYNLFDNIYRVIQKVIRSKDESYKDKWMAVQTETTENMVVELLRKLLPNSIIYRSNYYPVKKSLKQCNESDILVIYDNNLIIIEVKAGAYSYRAPIIDLKSHIKSLETLVEKADSQAHRTLEYIKSNSSAKFYDSNKNEKFEVSIDEFDDITLMSVTLDNFNEFSAKIEKMTFLKINKNSIAISIDDLRVYSEYFDSPIEFLHFLNQRKIATENKSLYLNDELDHLGMYIDKNWYSRFFISDENRRIQAYGYRERLDEYFASLINRGFEIEKPKQALPVELNKIISFLGKSKIKGRVKLGTYLLDFSPETRQDLNNKISLALTRQGEINRMVQIALMGETPLNIFCHQENINNMSSDETKKYTLAHMLEFNEAFRLELNIYYDIENRIKDIDFKLHEKDNILKEDEEEIKKFGKGLFNYRIDNYKSQNGISKIGRNDKCPCGSNNKYKKCHGKNI